MFRNLNEKDLKIMQENKNKSIKDLLLSSPDLYIASAKKMCKINLNKPFLSL